MFEIKIFIVRHGITDWNIEGRLQGRENTHLNEDGIRQAHDCGESLAGLNFKYILSSPLDRAFKTTEILTEYLDIKTVIVENQLTERDFGVLSGKKPAGRDIFNPGEDTQGIEPLDDVIERFKSVMLKYAELTNDSILVVSHGAIINAFLKFASDGEIGSGKTRLINAGVNIVEYDGEKFRVLGYNLSGGEIKKYM